MIGETNKNKQDFEAAIKYYLKGITCEPGNNENFIDLAKLCSQLGEMELSNIVLIFGKAVQQIKLLEKWLENFDEMFDENELVFEIIQDETIQKEGENVATGQEQIPEIRIKEEYHKRLIQEVCDLKARIQKKKVAFKLMQTIHTLQRLAEKLIDDVQSRQLMSQQQNNEVYVSQNSPTKTYYQYGGRLLINSGHQVPSDAA